MNFLPIRPSYRNSKGKVVSDLEYMPSDARPKLCEDTRGIMAIKDGVPQAMAVFDSWSINSCMIHIWIGNPFVLKHGFAEAVFGYVFSEESGRELIIGITPSDNEKALKFIRHMGFTDKCKIKDGYAKGVDYVVTEMRKKHCRYI